MAGKNERTRSGYLHKEIDEPSFFNNLVEGLRARLGARELGLLLVPQEGKWAGEPLAFRLPNSTAAAHSFEERLLTALVRSETVDVIEEFSSLSDPPTIVPITGNFGSPIGFIWSIRGNKETLGALQSEASFIATIVENSKKSRLHEVVSNGIVTDRSLTELYESVAKMVKSGLYCEMVIVWARADRIFRSFGEDGWDIVSGNTLVRRANEGEVVSVPSLQDSHEKIHYRDRLIEKGINSFLLIPVRPDIYDDESSTICIIGVFYKRIGGNTQVDFELANYVADYFKNVWTLMRSNQQMKSKLTYFDEILDFHEKAVSCMVSFHEIKSILQVMDTQVSSASMHTAADSTIAPFLETALQKIKRGEYLLEEHAETFATAGSLDESLAIPEGERVEKCGLRNYLRNYLDGYILRADELGVKLRYNVDNAPQTARIDLDHVDLVIDNLLTNAFNALEFKQHGRKEVDIAAKREGQWLAITVKDNGMGIEKSLKPHVFSANITTRKRQGGRGIGLAIIWKIGSRYGRLPEVESNWGYGATFRCWIKTEKIFD